MRKTPANDEAHDDSRWDATKLESPKRAATQLALGGLLFAGLCGAYLWSAHREHAVKQFITEATPLIERGALKSLRDAEATLMQAMARKSSDGEVHSDLAELYALMWVEHGVADAENKAKEHLARAISAGAEKAPRYSAELLIAYGDKRHADVIARAKELTTQGAVSSKLYFALGLSELATGKWHEGRENLRKAHELSSTAAHYARALGDAYDAEGNAGNATLYWELSCRESSDYVQGCARTAEANLRAGRKITAATNELKRLDTLGDALQGPKGKAALLEAHAIESLAGRRPDDAIKIIDEAIKSVGVTARLLAIRADARFAKNEIDPGLHDIESAVKESHGAKKYILALIDLEIKHNRADKALERIRQEATASSDPTMLLAQGRALLSLGKNDEAKRALDAALKLNADFPEALVASAELARGQGDFKTAQTLYEKAASARPQYPEVYRGVGLMWIKQGALKEADQQLEIAERMYRQSGASNIELKELFNDAESAYKKAGRAQVFANKWAKK